jgi:hypothetical protein
MTQFQEIILACDKPYNDMNMAFIKSLFEAEGIKYFFEGEYSWSMSAILPLPRLYVLSCDYEKAKILLSNHDLI